MSPELMAFLGQLCLWAVLFGLWLQLGSLKTIVEHQQRRIEFLYFILLPPREANKLRKELEAIDGVLRDYPDHRGVHRSWPSDQPDK